MSLLVEAGRILEVKTLEPITYGAAKVGDPIVGRVVEGLCDLIRGTLIISAGASVVGTVGKIHKATKWSASIYDTWMFPLLFRGLTVNGRTYPIDVRMVDFFGRPPCQYGNTVVGSGCIAVGNIVQGDAIRHRCSSQIHTLHSVTIPRDSMISLKFLRPVVLYGIVSAPSSRVIYGR